MGYLAEGGYVLLVVALGQLLHKRFHASAGATRKLVHILIGLVFPIQYYFFRDDPLGLLLPPALIALALFFVARLSLIPSMVNPKNPYGIFYYALGILTLNLIAALYPPFHAASGAAIVCLSLGDGTAALPGLLLKRTHPLYREKTVEGALLCFLSSVLGMLLLGLSFPALLLPLWLIFTAAAAAVLLELFTGRLDNLAILFGVAALTALLSGVALC